ncbi:MAG: SusF/SusE family outer membrane protein [Gelidibacter sp.]|nr:SusF/SusE family outer membrane protein [Gelidibacter sp.]
MKYIYKIVLLSLVIIGFNSCDANENFEILPPQEGITINNPVNGSTVVLDDTNTANPGLTVSWSAPTLVGTAATYMVEVALTGTDFAAPVLIGTTDAYVINLTVEELNTLAIDVLEIPGETTAGIDIRISSGEIVSNKVSVILTPYKVEFTELFLVGSLTNWTPAEALPMTRLGFNEFEITVDLPTGAEFKFLPQNTGWDGDFGKDPNNEGVIIQEGEQNISGYTAGKYKIKVNLNTFTFTVTEVISPNNLFLVGSLTGWDPTTSLPFFKSGENIFTIVIDLPTGGEFKFLPTNTGWDGDWGVNPNTAGGIVQDGEDNVKGYAAGKYLVTVDYNTLTYKLTSVGSLNVVGSINGWDNASALPMAEASLGIFSIVLNLPAGAEFKFLPTLGSWDGDWGADGSNAGRIIQDGESNLSGYEAGKYVVAVNYNTMSYTVSKITAVPTNLYLVGGFNGWSNTAGNPQFTQTSAGVFEITQTLSANDEFKFVPVAGSWDNDFGESKVSKKVLEQNDENNLKVTAGGSYKITINFNKGNISVVLQ